MTGLAMRKRPDLISNIGKYGGLSHPPYADYNGCMALCAAIIDRAHQDYIVSSETGRQKIINFLHSDLFTLYTMGHEFDINVIVEKWDKEREKVRSEYADNIRIRKGVYY